MLDIKVGDKLLCKKDLTLEKCNFVFEVDMSMEKGKYYEIHFIDIEWYKDSTGVFIVEIGEFHVGGNYHMMLWDYFCTPQEERKIKLEMINDKIEKSIL